MSGHFSSLDLKSPEQPTARVEIPLGDPRSDLARAAPLVPCPDCRHQVSRYAEACPNCGRYFQNFHPVDRLVVPGSGWVAKIAWGIVLSSILWAIIFGVLFFLFAALLGGLAGVGSSVPRR